MIRTVRAVLLLGALLTNSCYALSKGSTVMKDDKPLTTSDLIGRWSTEVLETEMGEMQTELLFSEHEIEATIHFIGEDGTEPMVIKAPYEIKEGYLTTEAIFKGKSVQILLDGPVMTLKAKKEQLVLKREE